MRQHTIPNGYNNPAYGSWTDANYLSFDDCGLDDEPNINSHIALNVQAAQLTDNDANTPAPQSILVAAQDGAAVSADTGGTALIGAKEKIRIWVTPTDLTIDEDGNATAEKEDGTGLWDSTQGDKIAGIHSADGDKSAGIRSWIQMLKDFDIGKSDTAENLEIKLPASVALGLHTIVVQRLFAADDQNNAGGKIWIRAENDPVLVKMQGRENIRAITTGYQVNILDALNQVVKELNYTDFANVLNEQIKRKGTTDELPNLFAGYKTDQLAFSEDNRLLFVAGVKGHIAIVDTATLRLVDYIQVTGSTDNIASLAVAGDYLYVAEGGRYTAGNGAHRLMRVNIDATSKDFMKAQQIKLPEGVSNINAPYGYFDLAILKGNHNYLAVTASKSNITLMQGITEPQGQVFVLDLNALTEPTKQTPTMVGVPEEAIRIIKFPSDATPTIGKGPQYITPATVKTDANGNPEKVRFLLSNAFDYNKGADAIEIDLNKTGDNMGGFAQGKEATVTSLALNLNPNSLGNLINTIFNNKYQLNVQRAQGAVYYYDQASDTEYALVADYHMIFNDPGWVDGKLLNKQIGGKVGIIKDPFGLKAETGYKPEYLGSTTPIINASIKDLSLSPDSNTLLGNINYWAQTGDTNPPSSGVLKWDLAALIKAANDHSIKKQVQALSRTIPFDREGSYAENIQIPAATPEKIDFGWVFGMANNITPPVVQAGNANYGDIARIDIVKAIEDTYTTVCPLITGFNQANIWIEPASQQYAEFVTYKDSNGKTKLVSGAQNSMINAVSAASAKSYTGNFGEEGVFFLSPQFTEEEMQALRAGERLPDRFIKIRVSGLTVGGEKDQSFVIEVKLKDFTDAAGRVFFGDRPTDDPGYTAFQLSGANVVSSTNVVDTAAEALDVWRVEQRLKYLAFPAMYTGSQPTVANNTIQDFKVDGQFNTEERASLKLFEKVVRYGPDDARQFNTSTPGADGLIEAGGGEKDITMSWLNAYNAPHWMQFFKSTPGGDYPYATSNPSLPGWENRQRGDNPSISEPTNIELYGTSWVYDLMAATRFAPDQLRGDPTPRDSFLFNGATDANYGFTPLWNPQNVIGQHQTHDLGMAFDLGVSGYIDKDTQQTYSNDPGNTAQMVAALDAAMQANADGWSVADAVSYSSRLVSQLTPAALKNDQVSALRDFLSLYALTQTDGQAGLAGKVLNTTAAKLFGGMITKAHIGGETYQKKVNGELQYDSAGNPIMIKQNSYPSINAILGKLGITSTPVVDHQNHFHIYLKPPTPEQIDPAHLLADAATTALPTDLATTPAALQSEAQGVIDYTQTLIEGEELMFIMDVPYIPAQDTPIVLAQAAAPGATLQPDYILNTCKETESTGDPRSAMRAVDPAGLLAVYLQNYDNRVVDMAMLAAIKTTLLEGTQHGKIFSEIDNVGLTSYHYDPTPNYIGNDRAVFLAEFEGKVYKIVLELRVFRTVNENNPTCPEPTLIKVNGKPVSGALGSDVNVSVMDSLTIDASAITVTFADLAGGAVGQAVGNTITLDDNAAGHNWYIDPTPADNSEYLPTSNPYEWVAKAGTAAYGKMDMLSVLLHEYGHALGINHSADNHDYMATTLTPGVRRMPGADEMALMQQLVAQAKEGLVGRVTPADSTPDNSPMPLPIPLGAGFGMAFIGRMRKSSYGGTTIDTVGAQFIAPNTQYAVAANATFTNLNTSAGWNTQGSVDIASGTGTATLNEISTSQTRLSQVFMLNEQDRYLSFTLSGAALDDLNGAPDDAFEVALLDANTGLSVLGGNGLTRTDSFLNLQGDGTEHAAQSVTRIDNADGSRTYRVDLTGVAKNTAVNLSFDLLGFGQDNSHVTLSDIRVSGLPQLHDDVATLAEDNLLTFDPFAQADSQLRPLLAAAIVTSPTHGAVTVNADGTFAYTPDLNYFGTDSFSYRLSDGPLDSNLATVSLTVTPVNDAPVAADVAVTTAEDTALVIALGAYASDVDSTSITTQIVTGPQHGTLVANADGTFTYTANANYNGADSFTYRVNDSELDSNIATVNLTITAVNDAPVLNGFAATTDEDTPLNLNLLAAASDVDGDALTPVIIAGPLHGQLIQNADGTFTYTPDANYNGSDSFTY